MDLEISIKEPTIHQEPYILQKSFINISLYKVHVGVCNNY